MAPDIVVMVWEDHEYGLIAWKQQRSAELRSALNEAIEHTGPSLVVIPIDYRENRMLTERLGNIACAI